MLHPPASAFFKPQDIPKVWPRRTVISEENREQIFNPLAIHNRVDAVIDLLKPVAIAEMEAKRPLNLVHRHIRDIKRGGQTKGELRYAKIKKDIDALFPEGKYDFQEQLIKQLLRVSMKNILGKEYRLLIRKISKTEGWDTTIMNVVFIAARRGGKTTGTAGGIAAMANNIPSWPVVIFSGGLDSATEMCAMIGANLRKIAGGKLIKVTKKRVTVYHANREETTITPFPSSGQYDVSDNLSFLFFYCVCSGSVLEKRVPAAVVPPPHRLVPPS